MITLTPRPGRDYESATAAECALREGRDFYVRQPGHRWHGLPVNLDDLIRSETPWVRIEFAGGARSHDVAVAPLPAPITIDRRRST